MLAAGLGDRATPEVRSTGPRIAVRSIKPVVLLIEDNDKLRRLLRHTLHDAGYDVREAHSGQLGLQLAATRRPDVIILDLGLPDLEGAEVIRTLRLWWQTKPILVLSGRDSEAEKVAALELGADDYVVKPFAVPELLARVRAAIRRSSRNVDPSRLSAFTSHGVSVDIERRQATRDGHPVALTPNEFRVLAVLVRNAGLLVSADSLVRELWGPNSPTNNRNYLRSYMASLRSKLEDVAAQPKLLLTQPGVGYRIALDAGAPRDAGGTVSDDT
jgi:two-component system KDP operon response regulator KdpE